MSQLVSGNPKRNRTEVLVLTNLTARPSRLTAEIVGERENKNIETPRLNPTNNSIRVKLYPGCQIVDETQQTLVKRLQN